MKLFWCLLLIYFYSPYGDAQNHPCARDCSNTEPMRCFFNFTLELYRSMSRACYDCPFNISDCYRPDCIAGDGTERMLTAANRLMPGPSIEICLNDTIIVDATNNMDGMITTLHWHGTRQTETPYMDGAPWVTQCPINQFETFRYEFTPEDPGTYWWHSHIVCQRDGIFGSLIVRIPKELDPHGNLYDFDQHTMIVQTWHDLSCIDQFNRLGHSFVTPPESTLLINGRGRNVAFARDNQTFYTPHSRFVVTQGNRYRFRVISDVIFNCPIEISVANHTLTMISSDANDFQPVTASSFVIHSGERWDFIIEANQSVGLYWIKTRGVGFCAVPPLGVQAFQLAVLQYDGASETDIPEEVITWDTAIEEGIQVNAVNQDNVNPSSIALTELIAVVEDDESLRETPDVQLYITTDFAALDNVNFHREGLYEFNQVDSTRQTLSPQIDHISMDFPPSPFLSQRDELSSDNWCNSTTMANRNCTEEFCACTHVEQLPLNAIVELIIVDEGNFLPNSNHPLHLHGSFFRVVGMGRVGPNLTVDAVRELDAAGNITRILSGAPVKDTVGIVGAGYTILRFNSSNPGYWFFHCHIEIHVDQGMSFVFKIGENEQMVPVPNNFPRCGNYYQ